MDIYGLKNDAYGAYMDEVYLQNQHLKGSERYRYHKTRSRLFAELYTCCENATSVWSSDLDQTLKDEINELSTSTARSVRVLIKELGYKLS